MAEIVVKRAHRLAPDVAKQAVQSVAEKLKSELSASYHWQGDRLEFECPGAKGNIALTVDEVCVSVHLSWLLSAARGRIERAIKGYLADYLG
ncbi:MAG TPA: polyhydroxyalkanoic acid system family protein [Methylophilaceae bacterium]|nr:polyhydroxyalkanoic acid system family protein [Methylophilaceae bacterium]